MTPDASETLSYALTAGNTGGAFALNSASGQLTVANPAALDFETPPVFTLTVEVTDSGSLTDTATVSGTITPVNDAPDAVDDISALDGAEDTTSAVLNGTMLANDSDLDGDAISITEINGTALVGGIQSIAVTNGTVNIDAGDNITFTADPNYNGPVSFDYTISDGNGGTDTATVNITVTPVNDAPVANNDAFTVNEGSTTNLNLAGNDTDVDGTVDPADLNLLALNWQQSIAAAAAGEPVPEPSGMGLLMIAACGLMFRRRQGEENSLRRSSF